MRNRAIAVIAGLAILVPAGAVPAEAVGPPCHAVMRRGVPPLPERLRRDLVDRCVRLNEIQVLGTHNSYHVQPSEGLRALLSAFDQDLADSLEYTHVPLTEQLTRQGIRQLELDVFADPHGGLYASPVGAQIVAGPPHDPDGVLEQPGFKVLHVQDIDFRTRCLTLIACLEEIRAWSDGHPGHLPIMIYVEAKDAPIPDPGFGFVIPPPIRTDEFDVLDAEIRSVFGHDRLFTPDDLRGSRASLLDAVRKDGWPSLGALRGRVLFALDNEGVHRDAYLAGRPAAEGRVMFPSAAPPSAAAAFVKMNDPIVGADEIRALVADGFVVRTRADVPTIQARSGDTTQQEAAFASGAQWVSTDYPDPSPFGSGYVARLPSGTVARCNPVHTSAACIDSLLE